jgi:hypothetical protein
VNNPVTGCGQSCPRQHVAISYFKKQENPTKQIRQLPEVVAECHGSVINLPPGKQSVSRETNQGRSRMAIESHLETLERKHGALEKEISDALLSPASDDLKISDMKRRKLMLKEQIEKLKSAVTHH